MNDKELNQKLDRIIEALNAKGHPMQDVSTLKMAILDLIDVIRNLIAKK